MTRRAMIAALAAIPTVIATVVSGRRGYGEMDVDRWQRLGFMGKRRVLCDGKDITHDCWWFDDRLGAADVYVRGLDGKWFVDRTTGNAAQRRIYGRIEVV